MYNQKRDYFIPEEISEKPTYISPEFFYELNELIGSFLSVYHITQLIKDFKRFNPPVIIHFLHGGKTLQSILSIYRTGYPKVVEQLHIKIIHPNIHKFIIGESKGTFNFHYGNFPEQPINLIMLSKPFSKVEEMCISYNSATKVINVQFKDNDNSFILTVERW